MSVRLLRLYPSRYIMAKVPISESGTATLGMSVARNVRRKRKITSTTSATGEHEFELDVPHRRADGRRAIGQDGDVDGIGQRLLQLRQARDDAVHDLDDVRAGLPWMLTMTAGARFIHAACLTFSTSSRSWPRPKASPARRGGTHRQRAITRRWSATGRSRR